MAIAEANYKKFLEAQIAKSAPQNDDELGDLAMEVISNQNRDYQESSTMEGDGPSNTEPETVPINLDTQ